MKMLITAVDRKKKWYSEKKIISTFEQILWQSILSIKNLQGDIRVEKIMENMAKPVRNLH